MKIILLTTLLFWIPNARALNLSPSSVEVSFAYEAEFQTQKNWKASSVVASHIEFLFGYLATEKLTHDFAIGHGTHGMGTLRWPPQVRLLQDETVNGVRTIRYQVQGVLLLNKNAAQVLVPQNYFDVFLPYDLDHYYDDQCTDPDEGRGALFWYFYDPFQKGCEHLLQAPLARPVRLGIGALPEAPQDLEARLDLLRGDNGNGDLFQVTTISGFSDSGKKSDDGRVAYLEMNQWFRDHGFHEEVIQRYQDRPIYQYEKTLKRHDGSRVQLRVTRLLADTSLETKSATFAKFFKTAVKEADVVIYSGHSGAGVEFSLAAIEERAGPLEFDPRKQQLFFFDACSGYEYYLDFFRGRKDPGTLAVMTYGLSSLFGYENGTDRALFKHLFDVNDEHPQWLEIMNDMERPQKGLTFMLNVDLN